ncbi:hypothetical protein BDN67DRAFT_985705 [Paxillus ammoniavirescens]|nr:hypothetical protein BDN67DRAFT_985705 [Paxillus ammoniavirescens]
MSVFLTCDPPPHHIYYLYSVVQLSPPDQVPLLLQIQTEVLHLSNTFRHTNNSDSNLHRPSLKSCCVRTWQPSLVAILWIQPMCNPEDGMRKQCIVPIHLVILMLKQQSSISVLTSIKTTALHLLLLVEVLLTSEDGGVRGEVGEWVHNAGDAPGSSPGRKTRRLGSMQVYTSLGGVWASTDAQGLYSPGGDMGSADDGRAGLRTCETRRRAPGEPGCRRG